MNKVISYKEIAHIFIPLALSAILTSVLALIDSTMILNYDVVAVSAVNVSTQLNQLFVPIVFGVASGLALFIVQFYEEGNQAKIKSYFQMTIIVVLFIAFIQFIVGFFFNEQIANFYFDESLEVNQYVRDYTKILAFNAFFIAIEYAFIFQLRSSKKTKLIFISALIKSITNIIMNYILIYGNFGFPELGIKGAALATVIATFVGIVFLFFASRNYKLPFVSSDIKRANVSLDEIKTISLTVWPIVVVELLFGLSRVIQLKEYSLVVFEQFNLMQLANMSMLIINSFVTTSTTVVSVVIGGVLVYNNLKFTTMTLTKVHKFLGIIVSIVMFLSIFIFPIIYSFT